MHTHHTHTHAHTATKIAENFILPDHSHLDIKEEVALTVDSTDKDQTGLKDITEETAEEEN